MFVSKAFRRVVVTINPRPVRTLFFAAVFALIGLTLIVNGMPQVAMVLPPDRRAGVVGMMWFDVVFAWSVSAVLTFLGVRQICRIVRAWFS